MSIRWLKYPVSRIRIRLSAVCMAAAVPLFSVAEPLQDPFAQQRELFSEALTELAKPGSRVPASMRAALQDYPLLPYLEYAALLGKLDSDTPDVAQEVDRFLRENSDTWLSARLERAWKEALARQERWSDLTRYHNPANSTTELTCLTLRSRLEQADSADRQSIFEQASGLWNVARSQPNECDPLFDVWREEGLMTAELVWERLLKTVRARDMSLSRYLARQLPSSERRLADMLLEVDATPAILRNQERFSGQSPQMRELVMHGLRQLALTDAPLALNLIDDYRLKQGFTEAETLTLRQHMALRNLLQGNVQETEQLLIAMPETMNESLVSWILRDALRKEDWQRVERWLVHLPEAAQGSERWTYWRARALAEKGSETEARALYADLARTRSFYGFLAADLLGAGYELVHRPVVVSEEQLQALAQRPALRRAHELFMLGDDFNARGEWQHGLRGLSADEILVSGRLAERWGWHRNTIQAMIQANYWDDLDLRFPLAYEEHFGSAANQLEVSPQLLMAIARQESAFMHDARSSAGAMGLMQLMPATAQQTARNAGLQISNQDLFTPEINIRLGSHYFAQMLREFDGNRILAAAAYNAGPNRVKQWLRQTGESPVPLDIWIETIPFAETRGYVQNVLAYSVIYGHRTGAPLRFLSESEARARL